MIKQFLNPGDVNALLKRPIAKGLSKGVGADAAGDTDGGGGFGKNAPGLPPVEGIAAFA